MGLKTYAEIRAADVSIKCKIAENWIDSSVNTPFYGINGLIDKNKKYYQIIFKINTIAMAMFIARHNKFDIQDDFWLNIKLRDVPLNDDYRVLLARSSQLFAIEEGLNSFYPMCAVNLPDEHNDHNINKALNSLSSNISLAILHSDFRNMQIFPSITYTLVTTVFKRNSLTFAWGLLGFSQGNQEWVNEFHRQNELSRIEIEKMSKQ